MDDHDVLIRIDERTEQIVKQLEVVVKKVEDCDAEIHDENGILNRLTKAEERQKNTTTLIGALWGVVLMVAAALAGLFFGHVKT